MSLVLVQYIDKFLNVKNVYFQVTVSLVMTIKKAALSSFLSCIPPEGKTNSNTSPAVLYDAIYIKI